MPTLPITAYELLGTNALFDVEGNAVLSTYNMYQNVGVATATINKLATAGVPLAQSFTTGTVLAGSVNPALINYVLVPYPAAVYPMNESTNTGVTNLTDLINTTPGQFVLFGWSQGAIVTSDVYDQIRTGSLTSRISDFLGGVTFGNPRRQKGHTFPLCSDPGGCGDLYPNLLANTETKWFDFADPSDPLTTIDPTTVEGQVSIEIMAIVNDGPNVSDATLSELVSNPIGTIFGVFSGVWDFISGALGPHVDYGSTTPLAPADTRNCAVIAIDYFHSLALGWNAATVPPVATAVSGAKATVAVSVPTQSGTYTYSVQQYDVTTKTLTAATLSGSPSVSGGTVTVTVTGLTAGHKYTFAVVLGTTYTDPDVTPTSMASNQITATS
jgi:hypothetical protein